MIRENALCDCTFFKLKEKISKSIHLPKRLVFLCFESCSHTSHFPVCKYLLIVSNTATLLLEPCRHFHAQVRMVWSPGILFCNQKWEHLVRLFPNTILTSGVPLRRRLSSVSDLSSLLWNFKLLVRQWLTLPPGLGSERYKKARRWSSQTGLHDANGTFRNGEAKVEGRSSADWPRVPKR